MLGRYRALLFVGLMAALLVAGCGQAAGPSPRTTPTPKPTATATPAPTQLTVLAPDGVNLRSGPTATASVLGIVAQGVTLPILSHTSAGGGWWEVKGSTHTGWMTADPQYTSTASFQTYAAGGTTAWTVLYPSGWQFAQQSTGQLAFTGPGGQTITVTQGSSTGSLPAAVPSGTATQSVGSVDIYGVTTSLVTFAVPSQYVAAVAFTASPGVAFLIEAKGPDKSLAAVFSQFLDTFKFPLPAASPTP